MAVKFVEEIGAFEDSVTNVFGTKTPEYSLLQPEIAPTVISGPVKNIKAPGPNMTWTAIATKIATRKGIPVEYLMKQIMTESNGNPKALGDSGNSRGLMQIHKNTAIGSLKMKESELDKLYDPEFNIEKGTDYILIVRNTLRDVLPSNKAEGWAMTFMAYNSGPGYMLKALKNLKARGIKEPTLAMAIEEMKKPSFGKTPIFSVTVPYATNIVSGIMSVATSAAKSAVKSVAEVKPTTSAPVLLAAILAALYFIAKKKRIIA